MKNKYCKNRINTSLIALSLTTGTMLAGEEMKSAPAPAPAEDVISGVLTLAANSHFISYGNDVWADGNSLSRLEFNPSLEFTFKLPENFSLVMGSWWDVTSKGATPSRLGGYVQEIDLWTGVGYTYDKFSIMTTYQAWLYGGRNEQILDVKLSYACFLSPSLTFHNRLSTGASGGDEGTIVVLGLSHTIEAGPVAISFPVNFATALTEDYHNAGGADSGYAYTSVGVQAAYPLAFLGDTYGKWSLTSGLNYYWTSNSVTVNNSENNFLTYNFGLSASF